jgi:Cys-rich protein (TIGR01571 family)
MGQPMQSQPFQGSYTGQIDGSQGPVVYGTPVQNGTAYTMNGQVIQGSPPQAYATNGQPMYAQQTGQPIYAQPMGQPVYAQPMMNGQMAIPVAAVYQTPNGQVSYNGRWSDGICDCFQDVPSCCCSFWFSPYRFAKTLQNASLGQFGSSLVMYLIPWLVFVVFDLLAAEQVTTCCKWAVYVYAVAYIIMIIIGTVYRVRIRQKYQIPGGEFEDCCCHFWCEPCAIAQEARHVDRACGLMT